MRWRIGCAGQQRAHDRHAGDAVSQTAEALRSYARMAAEHAGIDPATFERQIQQESGFDPNAHNAASGADGIAQIVTRWHPTMAGRTRDPAASLDYAAALMADHLAYWQGRGYTGEAAYALALSSYNAGRQATIDGLRGALDGWPYAETVNYVASIQDISQAEARRRLTGGTVPTIVYNPDAPIDTQEEDFDCSQEATQWGLRSLGRTPSENWMEAQMIADGVLSPEVGLTDGSGKMLAEWITKQYREPGPTGPVIEAFNNARVSFDDVRSLAGTTAVLIGGHRWGSAGHWVGVRYYDPAQGLILANSGGTGPVYGQQVLDRQAFDARAPFSMIVLRAVGASAPTEWSLPNPDVGSGLLSLMTAAGTAPATHSTFLPLGRNPALIEECTSLDGTIWRWHLPTGQHWRYPAA